MTKFSIFLLILINSFLYNFANSLKNDVDEVENVSGNKLHEKKSILEYNPNEAEMMLAFSAATYAAKKKVGTEDCLNNINKKHKIDAIHFGRYRKTNCDIFKNTCSVDITIIPSKEELIIAFEGTSHGSQLVRQAYSIIFQDTADVYGSEYGKVNRYYLHAVKQLWQAIEAAFIQYPDYAPIFVGHSMGGCLASIAALLYAIKCEKNTKEGKSNEKEKSNKKKKDYFNEKQIKKIKQFTFGEPRHGNRLYAKKHNKLIPHSVRYVNKEDVIAQMPFCFKFQVIIANVLKNTALACEKNDYVHQGQEIWFKYGMMKKPIICKPPTEKQLEDYSCSASQAFYLKDRKKRMKYIADHQNYFKRWVYFYGKAGCDPEKIDLQINIIELRKRKHQEALEIIWEEHMYNLGLHI